MVLDGLDCMNTTSHNYLTCIPYKQKHCGIAWGQPDVDANPFTYVLPAVGKEKQCNATGWQSWEMQCQYQWQELELMQWSLHSVPTIMT